MGKQDKKISLPNLSYPALVESKYIPGPPYLDKTLEESFRNLISFTTLHNLVKSSEEVGIVFCEVTHPAPYKTIIKKILSELTNAHEV